MSMLDEHNTLNNSRARAYTPSAAEGDGAGTHGTLAHGSMADWSWKPWKYEDGGVYRLAVTGPRCTCTLSQPVGTDCARHNF